MKIPLLVPTSFYSCAITAILATGMLVNSEATRRTVLASVPWLHADRVHLLYKGIDTDRFRPPAVPPARPVVGFVGQLIERKGLRDLMRAWTLIDFTARPDHPTVLDDIRAAQRRLEAKEQE